MGAFLSAEKKPGRPKRTEAREAMGTITFRLDEKERDMLDKLVEEIPADTIGGKSVVLRRLIRESYAKIKIT